MSAPPRLGPPVQVLRANKRNHLLGAATDGGFLFEKKLFQIHSDMIPARLLL